MYGFLDPDYLVQSGAKRFPIVMSRLLLHWGFEEAWSIDGAYDGGADIVAYLNGERWVIQCKWKQDPTAAVSKAAVAEVANARIEYNAHRAMVLTNARFANNARSAAHQQPFPIDLVDGESLQKFWASPHFSEKLPGFELRSYQSDAVEAVRSRLGASDRALVVMATGLGKTVVMGSYLQTFLRERPGANVLVIANMQPLVEQLERALWRFLPRSVKTHYLAAGHKPDDVSGVACATIQTAQSYVKQGYAPELVIIDEAHHIGADNTLNSILHALDSVPQLALTATPWRGDGYALTDRFGSPAVTISIVDGMKRGYLANVDYRLFADTVPWEKVKAMSQQGYGLKNLNSQLFLPQRDEKIRDELIGVWSETVNPRAIVFCQTIEHAQRMERLLSKVPQFKGAEAVHANLNGRDRQKILLRFRSGETPVIIAVDVLNEGVDVPDVNIVCFARVTHSRRIFIQQLGRGLRVSAGKQSVKVLDFISDLRRVAAALAIKRELQGATEEVFLPSSHSIEFVNKEAGDLMNEFISEAAEIEDADDSAKLSFPDL